MAHKAKKTVLKQCCICKEQKDCYITSSRCKPCNTISTREYRLKNLDKIREIHRISRMRVYLNSARERLRTAANSSVKRWRQRKTDPLVSKPCSQCGHEKAEAHHDSYLREDWRNIRWLCRACHEAWHSVNEPKYPEDV
jgi:hypothetical protein